MDKPGLSPEMLRIVRGALTLLGMAVLVYTHSKLAPQHFDEEALRWLAEGASLLIGKELLGRLGDVSRSRLMLEVERATSRPPSQPPAAEQ